MATGPYERRHSGETARALPGASPGAFGADVGEALRYAGGVVDRIKAQAKEREADEEAASAAVEMAEFGTEVEKLAVVKREEAAEGAAGHTDGLVTVVKDGIAARLAKIRDPKVRAAYEARYEALRGTLETREYVWERAKAVAHQVGNLDKAGTAEANRVATMPTPGGLELAIANTDAVWDATGGIDADTRTKGKAEQKRKIVVAYGNAMQNADPALLKTLLDKGVLNEWIEPEDINTLRSGALVEIRRGEALLRQQKNDAVTLVREEASIFRKGIALGNQPDYKEFDALVGRAQGLGLNDVVADLTGDRVKLDINRETRDWTPAQWASAVNTLEAKGDKRSSTEDIRLAQLKAIRGGRVAQANADPHAAAALAGNPPPPLNAVPARVAWAQGYAKSAGLVEAPYLSPQEVEPYRARMAQGVAGTVEVAREIRQMFGVRVGQQVLRQVDASNKDAQLLVGLPPVTAESVAIGTKALEQNNKLAPNALANEVFAEYRGAIPDELEDSLFRAAKAITARFANGAGVTDWEDSPEGFRDAFRVAVQRAGGMLTQNGKSTGGFVRWNGKYAVLPQDMARDDFQRRISRAAADPQRFVAAAGTAPHFRTGDGTLKPMSAEQMRYLGKYHLKTWAPGVYSMVGPAGGDVVDQAGKPWLLDVRKLP